MEPTTLLAIVLGIISIAWAVWLCRFELAAFLKADPHERVVEGPERIDLAAVHPRVRYLYYEFGQLGFVHAGVYSEWLGLLGPAYDVVFCCPEGDCFGRTSWSAVPGCRQPNSSFVTAFANGAAVLTQNHPGGIEANNSRFRAGPPAKPTALENNNDEDKLINFRWPLAEVLAEHRGRIEQFREAGHLPIACASMADYLEAVSACDRQPFCRFIALVLVTLVLLFKILLIAVGPLLLWWFSLAEPLPVTAALAADCLLMSLFMPRSWWPSVKHAHHLGLLEPPSSQAADSNLDNAAL